MMNLGLFVLFLMFGSAFAGGKFKACLFGNPNCDYHRVINREFEWCDVSLSIVDYREARDTLVHRELKIHAEYQMKDYHKSQWEYMKSMKGGWIHVFIDGRTAASVRLNEDTSQSFDFAVGPDQTFFLSYIKAFYIAEIRVLNGKKQLICQNELQISLPKLRREFITAPLLPEPEFCLSEEREDRFFVRLGEQPFTIEEIKEMIKAVNRAEMLVYGSIGINQVVTDSHWNIHLPHEVELLKDRVRYIRQKCKFRDEGTQYQDDQLIYLTHNNKKYASSCKRLPRLLRLALIDILDFDMDWASVKSSKKRFLSKINVPNWILD